MPNTLICRVELLSQFLCQIGKYLFFSSFSLRIAQLLELVKTRARLDLDSFLESGVPGRPRRSVRGERTGPNTVLQEGGHNWGDELYLKINSRW